MEEPDETGPIALGVAALPGGDGVQEDLTEEHNEAPREPRRSESRAASTTTLLQKEKDIELDKTK